MLFSIKSGNVPGVNPDQRRLVYLLSTTEQAYGVGLACVVSDGSAATAFTRFADDPARLDDLVDWPLMPGAVEDATAFIAERPELRERYDRVERLIDGFETPYGLELLASTHWVVVHEHAEEPALAAERVRAWNARKGELFTDEHVAIAWRRLHDGGWLAAIPASAGV